MGFSSKRISDPAVAGNTLDCLAVSLQDSAYGSKGTKTFSQVTVGTTAVQLAAANTARKNLVIVNGGTATIYLGKDGSVTATGATGGIPLPANASLVDENSTDAWFAVSGTAGQDVRVLQVA